MASASNPAASNPAAFNPAESNPATSKTAVFYIFHRDEEGKPDRLISYEEEGASYLLAATNICREVLDHETGRKALGTIATAFMKLHPHDGWTKRSTSAQVVDRFIQLIFDTFPWLFIDDGFPNQNISACHYRRKYDPFFTRHQAICLNGSRFRDMCITAKKAKETNNPKSQESEQYRNFIFFFATTLVHELAHLFVTFLSLGDSNTPPELVPKLSGIHKRDYAESGNYLEELLFGGSVVFQYDNDYDQHQPGSPHLAVEKEVGQISQQAVDKFLGCNFDGLPFHISGLALTGDLTMFGKDDNADLPNDPLNWPQTKRLAESHPLNEFDFGTLEPFEPSISIRAKVQVGRQSDLVRVAFEPTLRIKEVK